MPKNKYLKSIPSNKNIPKGYFPSIYNFNKVNNIIKQTNLIPYPVPNKINREIWHNKYITQLIEIYSIIIKIICERYPKNNIRWFENHKIFHNLSRLIYHCSTKHIESNI